MASNRNNTKNTRKKNTRQTNKGKQPAKTSGKKANAAKRTQEAPKNTVLSPRVRSVLYAALAGVFIIMILFRGASLWTNTRAVFIGIFGPGLIFVPAACIYLCVMSEKEKTVIAHLQAKIALCALTVLFAGAFVYIVSGAPHQDMNYPAALGNLFLDAYRDVCTEGASYFVFSCGFIGGILGYPLAALCGSTVGAILSLICLLAMVLILANLSVNDVAKAVRRAHVAGKRRVNRYRSRLHEQHAAAADNSETDILLQYGDGYSQSGTIDIPLDEPRGKRTSTKKDAVTGAPDAGNGSAAETTLSEDLQSIIDRASHSNDSRTAALEHIAESITQEKKSNRISGGAKRN